MLSERRIYDVYVCLIILRGCPKRFFILKQESKDSSTTKITYYIT
jgi:hypothetical protein